jgi:hypothetical protein
MSEPKGRKKLNLDLSPEAYERLQKLADESGKNMKAVLEEVLKQYGIQPKKGDDQPPEPPTAA